MKEIIKKSFLLGLGAASLTKGQADKIVKGLVKKNAITTKEGLEMLKRVRKEAKNESNRVKKFARQEATRIAASLGFVSKAQIGKVKKRLLLVDKELSSRGKKTLKNIIKELSK